MIQLPRSSPVEIDDEAAFTLITIDPPPSSMLRIPCLILLGALSAIWLTLWCRFSHHVFFVMRNAGIESYLLLFVFTICGTFPVSLFVKLLVDFLRGPIAEQLICYEFDSGIPAKGSSPGQVPSKHGGH